MNILVAPDKFAGTMSAREAGQAIAEGWLSERPADVVRVVPMADGGPGTIEAIASATGVTVNWVATFDQRGRAVKAPWIALDRDTAVVEAAAACGLDLLPENERDPLSHDTRGVGTLIRAVLDEGFTKVVVGLGGTGTVDGGVGAALALGARITGNTGRPLISIAPNAFGDITSAAPAPGLPAAIVAATDVTNPLLGRKGAARVFGPQKGASSADVEKLEASLEHLADVIESCLSGGPWRDLPGAGAGGGLGFGLMAWTGAEVVPGARLVGDFVRIEEHVDWADFVITGEGSLDSQSLEGKAPVEVLTAARRESRLSGVVVGRVAPELEDRFGRIETLGTDGLGDPIGATIRAGARLARRVASADSLS